MGFKRWPAGANLTRDKMNVRGQNHDAGTQGTGRRYHGGLQQGKELCSMSMDSIFEPDTWTYAEWKASKKAPVGVPVKDIEQQMIDQASGNIKPKRKYNYNQKSKKTGLKIDQKGSKAGTLERHARILALLSEKKIMNRKQISQAIDVDVRTISTNLKKLEKNGQITREHMRREGSVACFYYSLTS
jgi:DNA-binding transcriptional ArsR family regulator